MIRIALIILVLALLIPRVLITPPAPVQSPSPTTITFSAWLPYWDQAQVVDSLVTAAPHLSSITPLWYHLSPQGVLEPFNLDFAPIIKLASSSNLTITPLVGNELDGARVILFLDHPELWDQAIAFLIDEAKNHGFSGYDLDFEAFPPTYGPKYQEFIHQTNQALYQAGYTLSVSVPAYTSITANASHPYRELAASATKLRLMAYDYHYSGSPAGPITPITWLEAVLTYALSQVPVTQLELGLPLYGYDWFQSKGVALTYVDTQALIHQFSLTPLRDPASQALSFSYQDIKGNHQVWYEDATSLLTKIQLARQAGITQFVFWRLGGEDSTLWPLLNRIGQYQ